MEEPVIAKATYVAMPTIRERMLSALSKGTS
jgi:hypothetical protein